jgi:hypothetical protein
MLLEHYLPTFKEAYPIKFFLQHCLQIWSIKLGFEESLLIGLCPFCALGLAPYG